MLRNMQEALPMTWERLSVSKNLPHVIPKP